MVLPRALSALNITPSLSWERMRALKALALVFAKVEFDLGLSLEWRIAD